MSQILHQLAARFLQGVGLADADLDVAADRMSSYLSGCAAAFHFVNETNSPREALGFLSTLTFPETRHVLFAAQDCAALVHNSRNGSDYADYLVHAARHLHHRFARVVNSKRRIWTNGRERRTIRYEARIFELYDAVGAQIRSVCCMNDGGRWTFHAQGEPHAIEADFPYDAARKSARFTEDHLRELAGAFGLSIPDADQFLAAGRYVLFSQHRGAYIETCTIDEADDPAYWQYICGMQWMKHLESHAASAIASFEKCIELNPAYEPRVRKFLTEAYAKLDQGKP